MSSRFTPEGLREIIAQKIPQGSIESRHTDKEHFYWVRRDNAVYPSATGSLKILKQTGLAEWKMGRALDYVAKNYKDFTKENLDYHIKTAKDVSTSIFLDAGDIGTEIHDYRAEYFREWVRRREQPTSTQSFIPESQSDVRSKSAMRALEKFCKDYNYTPGVTELSLWSTKLKLAGSLDDLGFVGDDLVLIDIKTSNALKVSYHLQVALYAIMLKEITGIVPKKYMIVRLSKEDGTYEVEEIKDIAKAKKAAVKTVELDRLYEELEKKRKEKKKIIL